MIIVKKQNEDVQVIYDEEDKPKQDEVDKISTEMERRDVKGFFSINPQYQGILRMT